MTRLIDADEFKRINKRLLHCDFPYLSELTLEELLDEIPTVDAVPVVHGHWYVYETGYEDTEAKCSICGFETLVNEPGNGLHMVGDLKYCPHCGARMDGGAE